MSDLRLAIRQLAKSPGFTAVAVLTLALGIGLVTVQFSFVYGALIKGLPFEGAERIHVVEAVTDAGRTGIPSLHHFAALKERQRSFEFLAAYRSSDVNVSGADLLPRRYAGVECTADLLALTGVRPSLGRTLRSEDGLPGAPRVLVLGHDIWTNDFAADPAIVGRSLRIDGSPATIVGVMPAGFAFPLQEQAWTNLAPTAAETQSWIGSVNIVGRLRAGIPLAQARSEFDVLAAAMTRDAPKRPNLGTHLSLSPLARYQVGDSFAFILWTLLAMVGAVLVLACVNVANLLHVRSVRQRHELAVRLALGAGRGRLVRQALVLSTLLSGLGAVAGAFLAVWSVPVVNHFLADPKMPYWVALELDWRVLAATAGLTLAVGMVAGLLPALRSLRIDPIATLRDGGHGSTGLAIGRLSRLLTVGQIVLATAVLVVATVLGRGVYRAGSDCYPGDTARVLVATTLVQSGRLRADGSDPAAAVRRFREELTARSAALPGVEAAALTTRSPDRRAMPVPVEIEDRPAVAARNRDEVSAEWISSGYFRVFGLAPLRGRLFTDADRAGGEPVVVVNESFARRYWPGEEALGRRCRIEDSENEPQWHTVIGVVADLPMAGVALDRHQPGVYLPLHEIGMPRISLLLLTAGSPLAQMRPLQVLLQELAPDRPFQSMLTLKGLVDQRLRLARLIGALALVFGITAGLLAAVGIFGVTAFGVEQRRREFGVRLALGAAPGQILGLVLRHGLWQLAVGLAAGLALGWTLNRPLQSISLFRTIARADAGDIMIVAAVVATGVLLACWLPARRATKVNPVEALRSE